MAREGVEVAHCRHTFGPVAVVVDCPGTGYITIEQRCDRWHISCDSASENARRDTDHFFARALQEAEQRTFCSTGCDKRLVTEADVTLPTECRRPWWTLWIACKCRVVRLGVIKVVCS